MLSRNIYDNVAKVFDDEVALNEFASKLFGRKVEISEVENAYPSIADSRVRWICFGDRCGTQIRILVEEFENGSVLYLGKYEK